MSKSTKATIKNNSDKNMTNSAGKIIADNQNSLSAGERGPLLLQDYELVEKLAHLNRERIPERVVHAKGWGAHGRLTITHDISAYTKAACLQPGASCDLFARFSTVAGEQGAADAERDVRGFSLKFYTSEGNWDMVGNNTPVFFVRDPLKFSDFIHTQKRHPKTHLRNANAMWDYWSLCPESIHQITILMSDRGCPTAPMFMNGYGSHTYSLINNKQERFWVKFHFKTSQGHKFYTNKEAAKIMGETRESYQEALFTTIEEKKYPKWDFKIQIMTHEQAEKSSFNPFDLTKVWPHADYPLIDVGTVELNKNPENYFSEVEQAAFSPSNIVPGISFSPDKVLQARIFSYPDAQRYRLGTHYASLPINAPKCPVHHYHKDGTMNFTSNSNNAVANAYYEPNSLNGPSDNNQVQYQEPALPLSGNADRYDNRKNNDDYSQAGDLFRLMNTEQQERLWLNIADAMQGVDQAIINKQLVHFEQCDPAYAQGVQQALENIAR